RRKPRGLILRVATFADTYYRCNLSVNEVCDLIRENQTDVDVKKRAIFRIWPDFKMKALIDRSVSTIKADAAQRSRSSHDKRPFGSRDELNSPRMSLRRHRGLGFQ